MLDFRSVSEAIIGWLTKIIWIYVTIVMLNREKINSKNFKEFRLRPRWGDPPFVLWRKKKIDRDRWTQTMYVVTRS